jgi:hypothetical protein
VIDEICDLGDESMLVITTNFEVAVSLILKNALLI